MTIGIVGLGVVGGTLAQAMTGAGVTVRGYDPYLGMGDAGALADADVVFVCVPTPASDDGTLDAAAVWKAIRDIEPHLATGTIVAVKSTVPPGTSDGLSAEFPRLQLASVPEFLVEAEPLQTLVRPDRIVVGARSLEAKEALRDLLVKIAPDAPFVLVSPIEAECIKLCSNAMLAAKVSLANELALVCDAFGVQWNDIKDGVGLDRRIGVDHLSVTAERGFGGACLPKDLNGLITAADRAGFRPSILSAITAFNDRIRSRARSVDQAHQDDLWTLPSSSNSSRVDSTSI